MLNCRIVKMFNSIEIYDACREVCGRDIEGSINEIVSPSTDGAYSITIPFTQKEYEDYSDEECILFHVLKTQAGLKPGETCYIEVDY